VRCRSGGQSLMRDVRRHSCAHWQFSDRHCCAPRASAHRSLELVRSQVIILARYLSSNSSFLYLLRCGSTTPEPRETSDSLVSMGTDYSYRECLRSESKIDPSRRYCPYQALPTHRTVLAKGNYRTTRGSTLKRTIRESFKSTRANAVSPNNHMQRAGSP
jgi:hypothetical protein